MDSATIPKTTVFEEKIKYDYIIYHRNCFDGFSGFYLFMKSKLWIPKPIVFPDVPSSKKIPPNINGKNVIIIDVAYDASVIKKISELANKILFIDHHVTIQEDIKKLKLDNPHEIVYDDTESGASLVWKYFFKNEKMPKFIKYIKDNDIGAWKYKKTHDFIAALEVNFKLEPNYENLKHWDNLLDDDFLDSLIERGHVYNEYKNHLIKQNYKKYNILKFPSNKIIRKFKDLAQFKPFNVAVINSNCPSTSLLGKYIVENVECDFCLLWNYSIKNSRYVISLRSREADVGIIAKIMGGGGHKFASSFSFKSSFFQIDDLFFT